MSSNAMKKPTLMVAKAKTFAGIDNSPGWVAGRRISAVVALTA
jgi:hypothetical protein